MTGSLTDSSIPLLDLGRLDAGEARRSAFLAELRAASRDVGFFYLTGHGVDPDLLRDLLGLSRRFFALPVADKLAVEMVNSPHFRGYNRVAWELTRGAPDWREQIDIGAERPALPREPGEPAWTRLQGPNQWPAALPELRPLVLRWQKAAMEVLARLMRAFALALGQAEDTLEPLYGDEPHHLVKLIRYPGRDTPESEQGVGAHKDAGLLTLLLQDSQEGLQVETADGWIGVAPRAGVERISVAFFLCARVDATVPLLHLPTELPVQARGPESDPNNPMFRSVGQNYLKGRLRSHPDVARRHHADLLARQTDALNGSLRE